MKKLLAILFCIVLFLPTVQTASAAENPAFSSEEAAMSYFDALSQAQAGAVAAHDALVNAFWPDAYPENYGGAYIEDNLLHINIVDLDHQDLAPYEAVLTGHLDVVRFRDVVYSMYTLKQAMELIWEDLRSLGVHVYESGVSSTDNAVTIGITRDSVSKLPAELVLDVPSFYTPFQVPVLVTVGEIPTLTSAAGGPNQSNGALPFFFPVLVCGVCVLAVAGFLLIRQKR